MRLLSCTGLLVLCTFVSGAEWGYSPSNGPDTWSAKYPECAGKFQSPLNLDSVVETRQPRLRWVHYEKVPETMTLANDGHTVYLRGNNIGNETTPLLVLDNNKVFALDSMHFHWGKTSTEGSEHTFLGKRYPLESHAIHKRIDDNGEVASPLDIIVVASMYQVSLLRNTAFDGFLSAVSRVQEEGTSAPVRPIPWSRLIHPFTTKFYMYRGSLTTPPCTEVVTFIIRDKLFKVSENQLEILRTVHNEDKEESSGNFRPVQPKNGRDIYYVL